MRRIVAASIVVSLAALVACPGPKMPSGPPPEYEEPPAPSWMRDAEAPSATPTEDASVPTS